MIKSMTGFGHAEKVTSQCKITVELKSVNHRYLDLNIKLPRRFNMLEGQVRNLLKQYMQRGKVDVFITYEDYISSDYTLKYNKDLAAEYLRYLNQMAERRFVITPHMKEMSRLTGLATPLVNAERERVALDFAQKYGVVTVLKGAGTVIASPNGKVLVNPTGNSGMATGGSGDVLAGMTASILAQGASAFSSAAAAVYLHGLAGDIAAEKYGKISMLPTDLINCIPLAYKRCGF